MRAEMPRRRATHAEAADQNTILVDRVLAFHRFERFEKIDFAGQLAGVAVAAVEVQHDRVRRREFARIPLAVVQEIDFAQRFSAAVEPCVEAPAMRRVRRIGSGDYQPVGLHGAVDLRHIAAHDQARRARPGRRAVKQRVGALLALTEQVFGMRDIGGLEEFAILQPVANSLVEDLDVGSQGIVVNLPDTLSQTLQAGLELGAVGRGNGNAGRRNRLDLGGLRGRGK